MLISFLPLPYLKRISFSRNRIGVGVVVRDCSGTVLRSLQYLETSESSVEVIMFCMMMQSWAGSLISITIALSTNLLSTSIVTRHIKQSLPILITFNSIKVTPNIILFTSNSKLVTHITTNIKSLTPLFSIILTSSFFILDCVIGSCKTIMSMSMCYLIC